MLTLPVACYLASACFVGILAYFNRRGTLLERLRDPFSLFLFVFMAAYLISPAAMIGMHEFRYADEYSQDSYFRTLLYILTFFFSVTVAYFAMRGDSAPRQAGTDWKPLSSGELRLLTAVCLVPAAFGTVVVLRQILTQGWGAYLADRVRLNAGAGYLLVTLTWPLVLLVVATANLYQKSPKILTRVLIALIAMAAAAIGLMQGSRTLGVLPFVFLVATRALLGGSRRIPKSWIVAGSVLGAGVVLLSGIRQSLMATGEVALPSESTVAQPKGLELGEVENIIWLLEHPNRHTSLNGATFLAVASGFVPRKWWPDKPLGAGPHLKNFISPGSYDLQLGTNLTSYTPGLLAEALMNFGLLGAPLIGGLYGALLAYLRRAQARLRGPIQFAAWFFTLYSTLYLMKGEVFGVSARLFALVLPLILATALSQVVGLRGRATGYRQMIDTSRPRTPTALGPDTARQS